MTNGKHICEYCLGAITAPRHCSLERTVAIHLDSCPAAHRGRKVMKVVVPEPEPERRRRVIPRQALDD